jgi:hypothetical protein
MDQLRVVGISGGSVERGNLTPDREAVGHFGSPLGRAEQMPSGPGDNSAPTRSASPSSVLATRAIAAD